MFWADRTAQGIREAYANKVAAGETLIIRDEKTASGRVHVGSMRGVAIHGEITQILATEGVAAKFLYEINDFDHMDGIPAYLDQNTYREHLGKLLLNVPAPDGKSKNFAEQYAVEFQKVIAQAGFTPEYYRASELYQSGKMNTVIRQILEGAETIRRIYREVSGSKKPEGWLPISMVCEKCEKALTTQAVGFDGQQVQYVCEAKEGVGGSIGCGHEGGRSPYDGNAKLPWKVEWPAKWVALGVHVEGAGKDHTTKGGARDVSNHITREVFSYEPPYDIPYEFFLVEGAKMSSSKGQGSSAADVAEWVPTKIFRLALLGTRPMRAINFDPTGDTIPTWFDWYDKVAEVYWSEEESDDARLFERVHQGAPPGRMYLPRFSSVAFLVQMEHLDLEDEVAKIKEAALTEPEKAELAERAEYARAWLREHAPERYRFDLQRDEIPAKAQNLSDTQKEALRHVRAYIEAHKALDGPTLHTHLHDVKRETGIAPKELFSAIYLAFLGRESGPQAGWFLSTLEWDFLIERLKQVTK